MPQICAAISRLAAAVFVLTSSVAHAEPAVRFVVADAACGVLDDSNNSSDVTFRPGVDVHGRPVTPADLDSQPLRVPMPVTFDVSIDVAERLGLSPDVEALLNVAQVSEQNGEIFINGRPADELGRSMARLACVEAR